MPETNKYLFDYKLAVLCERSYTEKTIERHGVQVLIEEIDGVQHIIPRATEISIQNPVDVLRDMWVTRYETFGMRGHEGMIRGAESILDLVCENVDKSNAKAVHLAGHSLGGGLAIPLAIMLREIGYNIDGCVTFGCPLVLSQGHELLDNIPVTQYRNKNDIVTLLQMWTNRKHFDITQIGGPLSDNWLINRTWDDHGIDLYQKELKILAR
jgi:hypothetical protein